MAALRGSNMALAAFVAASTIGEDSHSGTRAAALSVSELAQTASGETPQKRENFSTLDIASSRTFRSVFSVWRCFARMSSMMTWCPLSFIAMSSSSTAVTAGVFGDFGSTSFTPRAPDSAFATKSSHCCWILFTRSTMAMASRDAWFALDVDSATLRLIGFSRSEMATSTSRESSNLMLRMSDRTRLISASSAAFSSLRFLEYLSSVVLSCFATMLPIRPSIMRSLPSSMIVSRSARSATLFSRRSDVLLTCSRVAISGSLRCRYNKSLCRLFVASCWPSEREAKSILRPSMACLRPPISSDMAMMTESWRCTDVHNFSKYFSKLDEKDTSTPTRSSSVLLASIFVCIVLY
eukprot:PhM_4_TR2977/c0_g1_i1/m.3940